MPRVLIVDDEQHILELIRFNLVKEGWKVDAAMDGQSTLQIAAANKPDLILLDVMLPGVDGLEVCRRLQARDDTSSIPVIMLSAKSEELDKILGLEMGADDYITKPFSPRELIARIKARLRKKDKPKSIESPVGSLPSHEKEIRAGGVSMIPEKFEAFIEGKKLELTLKEFELLRLLITNAGKVFTRDFLLERVWGYEYLHDTRTVDVHIRHIRQKIEENPNEPVLIQTIRGLGYKFRDKN